MPLAKPSPRTAVAFLHDLVMAALAFVGALFLRLGDEAWERLADELWLPGLIFCTVAAVVFLFTGLYRGIWRYASLSDLIAIVKAATITLLIFLPVTFLVTRLEAVPRSAFIIAWFLLVAFLSAGRIGYRVMKDRGLRHLLERNSGRRVPVVLIGAGDAAEVFVREMGRAREAPYEVLALIDDKGGRVGRAIHNVPVLGPLSQLPQLLDRVARQDRAAHRLILTSRLPRETVDGLLAIAEARGMTLASLPRLTDFAPGDREALARLEPRPVAIEDLLGRTQATLDRPAMQALVAGRRVLVTGAGGSIGGELCRQLAALQPASLALYEASEFNLYSIDQELQALAPALPRQAELGDVRDQARLAEVFQTVRPELVFHAAALKHVPLVEENPLEGILTNVLGTRRVAEACRQAGCRAMVLISTDKAVNPRSVMGATKRLAEAWCQALDLAGRRRAGEATRFVTVRFGNVLGSTGSVVPLFQRQIAAGGPLTVTDAKMTRYFMTIREAVELVLQASALGLAEASEAGRIYVLDMGKPVAIVELARQMIRLAGFVPEKDIEIVFTGLRPGEKLEEELFHDLEALAPTAHPALRLAAPRVADLELLGRGLDELAAAAEARHGDEALRLLAGLVPEYRYPGPARPAVGRA
ncbi:MAG TPA: nucleoside-diphosphate sugar epimerase/dehydratase [Kiloniellales bacterium]|nr:nucleoside-diphosphate sugar epimerase/dehydratase [Kiloniellales bacterium]